MPDAGRTREPCVQKKVHLRTQATTGQPEQPAFPARWFTAYTRSPRCAGLVSHRRFANINSQSLTPAAGGQDHAISLVRESRRSPSSTVRVHRILKPTSVAMRGRPSEWNQDGAEDRTDPASDKAKYFSSMGLTRFRKISPTRLGKNLRSAQLSQLLRTTGEQKRAVSPECAQSGPSGV